MHRTTVASLNVLFAQGNSTQFVLVVVHIHILFWKRACFYPVQLDLSFKKYVICNTAIAMSRMEAIMKQNSFLFFLFVFALLSCDDDKKSTTNNVNNTNNTNNVNNTNNTNNTNNVNNTNNTNNNSPVCGNNIAETDEICDGLDLKGESCITQGFAGGTLICNNSCSGFITTGCTNNTNNNTGNGRVGDACSAPEDCSGISGLEAQCMTNLGEIVQLPGGYCTATCTAGTPDPCDPSGGVCVNVMVGSYCLKPCTNASECREPDYTCSALLIGENSATYCIPPMGGM